MRSRYADKFNHDDEAPGYDADVADEGNPIRAGYGRTLQWVAKRSGAGPGSAVLDLGTGTGNLSVLLGPCRRLVCVDVSAAMLDRAREKLTDLDAVEFFLADLLECFDVLGERFDAVVSTYAVHHLTEAEKEILFRRMRKALEPGGIAVFGDLMFADPEHRRRYLAGLRADGEIELAEEIEDEFLWDLESAVALLESIGFTVETERFSELSFGLAARLRA